MQFRHSALALAMASLLPFSALAQDAQSDDGMFSFSGYGTLGAVHNSENRADFVPTQGPEGAGYTHAWSTTPDTRLAAQVDARFTDNFSAVVQVISEYDYQGSYKPQVELAHVKYAFTPALQVRAGRFTAPIFMLSEYRKVGYAMPWVRPPVEVYDIAVSLDGADATYKFNVGDVAMSVQLAAGDADEGTFEVKDARTLALRAEFGSSTLFGSYSKTKIDAPTTPLLALYQGRWRRWPRSTPSTATTWSSPPSVTRSIRARGSCAAKSRASPARTTCWRRTPTCTSAVVSAPARSRRT